MGFPDSSVGKKKKTHLQCRRPWLNFWVTKILWRKNGLPTPVFLGFPGGSAGKESPVMQETWVWFLGWEDPLRRERLPPQVFWPGEFFRLYSPWGHKEWDTTERLSYSLSLLIYNVVLALGVQQSDSVIYTFFSPRFFSLIDYYKILSIVSCAIQ